MSPEPPPGAGCCREKGFQRSRRGRAFWAECGRREMAVRRDRGHLGCGCTAHSEHLSDPEASRLAVPEWREVMASLASLRAQHLPCAQRCPQTPAGPTSDFPRCLLPCHLTREPRCSLHTTQRHQDSAIRPHNLARVGASHGAIYHGQAPRGQECDSTTVPTDLEPFNPICIQGQRHEP